jgi:hypothetical protein
VQVDGCNARHIKHVPGKDLAIGHDDEHLRSIGPERVQSWTILHALDLQERQGRLERRVRDVGRRERVAAAGRSRNARDDADDVVIRCRQRPQ